MSEQLSQSISILFDLLGLFGALKLAIHYFYTVIITYAALTLVVGTYPYTFDLDTFDFDTFKSAVFKKKF